MSMVCYNHSWYNPIKGGKAGTWQYDKYIPNLRNRRRFVLQWALIDGLRANIDLSEFERVQVPTFRSVFRLNRSSNKNIKSAKNIFGGKEIWDCRGNLSKSIFRIINYPLKSRR